MLVAKKIQLLERKLAKLVTKVYALQVKCFTFHFCFYHQTLVFAIFISFHTTWWKLLYSNVLVALNSISVFNEASLGLIIQYGPILIV